jgi:hypothetical protein
MTTRTSKEKCVSKKRQYRLSDKSLRSLHIGLRPELDAKGGTVLVPNPDPKPYRFKDGSQAAPTGFGIYVGQTGAFFELVKRMGDKVVRVPLGAVRDLTLAEAHTRAREHLAYIAKGITPKQKANVEGLTSEARQLTVRQCMGLYIDRMDSQRLNGKRKEVSVNAARKSLSRLERPEVALADEQVANLTEEKLLAAWWALRTSSMLRSAYLSEQVKQALLAKKEWWKLDIKEYQALGLSGKYIERARAAGLVSVEHTFADLNRAINLAIKRERENAKKQKRENELAYNPLEPLLDMGLWRSGRELREHYRKAQVRNPLGEDDKSLPNVLKTLLARRSVGGGRNSVAVDYLLLTLLWGTRRNEAARLQWYDRVDKDVLLNEGASWVWLADTPEATNPTTKKKGSQVFFHDTKNGTVRFVPVTYFAERILRRRREDHLAFEAKLPKDLAVAESELRALKKESRDHRKIGDAEHKVHTVKTKQSWMHWVFPAQTIKAKDGHYSDSKSILAGVRKDSGLVDMRKQVDIGLTPHDLRRTLGRYASQMLPGRLVSDILDHRVRGGDERDEMADVSRIYSDQQWGVLRDSFGMVEERMIGSSPRVWNMLKGPDKQRLDEVNDPPVKVVSTGRKPKGNTEEE